jgi:glycolate oxidase FAD binding subunit
MAVALSSAEELAAALAEAEGPLRLRGGGTKLGWGEPVEAAEVSLAGLDRLLEYDPGDMTAVLEGGVPLSSAQEAFAAEGQMLALDPPDGGATLGGVIAAGDSGPLRARYGGPRDLVLGVTVALSDGTLAKSGGKVIKNVAGYDLAKLFTGSRGTLGAIVRVAVLLHPRPPDTCTAIGTSDDPVAVARAASELAHSPLEQLGLDVRWELGRGTVLSRFGGAAPRPQAEAAAALLTRAGVQTEIADEDGELWDAQRESQRPATGTVVRVSGLQTQLPDVLAAAERHLAVAVGRAGLGLTWLALAERPADETVAAVEALRRELAPAPCAVLDGPAEVRAAVGGLAPRDPGAAALMARVKERFDPRGALV